MTDEDTGSTAKTTKRKTTSTATRTPSKPRSKSAGSGSTATKAPGAKAAASAASAASTKTEAAPAPTAPAAPAAPATAAAAPSTASTAASGGSGSGGTGGSGTGGSGSGGSGSGGSGSGGGYTRVPASASSESGGSGLITLPTILSIAAIVIAILIPVLKDRAVGPSVKPEDVNALKVQQTELLTAVANLEASIEALGVEQDAMQASIAAVKVPSIMIAATDLNEAISSGDPFQEELTLFRAIVGENEAVASVYALEPLAQAGVPTTRELQAGFGDLSHAVIASYQTVESEGDLAKRVSETMANLTAATTRLRWRLDGATPPEGTSPLAVMARAEDAAEDADFDTVILEMEALPENLKAMTTSWVEQVEARKKATLATQDLELFMIETVASARN
ncbi:COG4223 family protein [Thalassobaculum sp.]|uniref:COG4223 family protein n=1 Tax=Thalassobaculum sp. TaxID=2022740 RepID=UPI003B59BCA2